MSIRSGLEKVLKEYINARENEVFAENPLASFIRHDLKESVEAACGNTEKYLVKGSAGQGVWARGPWVGVFNPIITAYSYPKVPLIITAKKPPITISKRPRITVAKKPLPILNQTVAVLYG